MKIIVTHLSPDLDAITAVWLIKRFYKGWQGAVIRFVPAGSTFDGKPPDVDQNVIHVDTGLGKFDHHQTNENTCAALEVFQFLKEKNFLKKKDAQALERLVEIVNEIDHFGEVFFPQPDDDRYELMLHQIIENSKTIVHDDQELIKIHLENLDFVFQGFKNKVQAEEELKKGLIFQSKFGLTIALFSSNEESLKLALKKNFRLAIRKDPKKKYLKIKSQPSKKIDLSPVYEKLRSLDPKAYWYLHPSKNIIINGSAKNPLKKPTFLKLNQVIEIIKKI